MISKVAREAKEWKAASLKHKENKNEAKIKNKINKSVSLLFYSLYD